MRRFVCVIISMLCLLVAVGCGNDADGRVASSAMMSTTEVKGSSKNCAVVLKAQQGTSYAMALESQDNWAHFANGTTMIEGEMEVSDKIVFVYFDTNSSGKSRTATISINFSDGKSFRLSFEQLSYDNSVAFEREWAELPACKVQDGYIYNTHYGALGIKSNARNYTYCFDVKNRASVWVAYPLHRDHMTGSGNRNNSDFGYDPDVESSLQAALGSGSYRGWYDRGHQLPAADRKCSQQMMDQTFYATNMTPQQYKFNQNKWGVLEGRVRNMTCADTLYVVTGAWFGDVHHSSIDSSTTDRAGNICPTPTHYFKALLRTKAGNTGRRIDEVESATGLRAIVFWLEHSNTGDDTSITSADCISVTQLEQITGIDFFPMINDAIEQEVEAAVVPSEWGIQ